MKGKWMAWVLTCLLLLTSVPVGVFAEETEEEDPTVFEPSSWAAAEVTAAEEAGIGRASCRERV